MAASGNRLPRKCLGTHRDPLRIIAHSKQRLQQTDASGSSARRLTLKVVALQVERDELGEGGEGAGQVGDDGSGFIVQLHVGQVDGGDTATSAVEVRPLGEAPAITYVPVRIHERQNKRTQHDMHNMIVKASHCMRNVCTSKQSHLRVAGVLPAGGHLSGRVVDGVEEGHEGRAVANHLGGEIFLWRKQAKEGHELKARYVNGMKGGQRQVRNHSM